MHEELENVFLKYKCLVVTFHDCSVINFGISVLLSERFNYMVIYSQVIVGINPLDFWKPYFKIVATTKMVSRS